MGNVPLQVFAELVNGDGRLCYPIAVEVLGKVKGGRLAVRLKGRDDDVDIAGLMIDAGFARKQSTNCIFGLEAEVENELLGGNSKVVAEQGSPSSARGQKVVLPPLTEKVKQDVVGRPMAVRNGTGDVKSGTKKSGGQDVNANVKGPVVVCNLPVSEVPDVVDVKKTAEGKSGGGDLEKFGKNKFDDVVVGDHAKKKFDAEVRKLGRKGPVEVKKTETKVSVEGKTLEDKMSAKEKKFDSSGKFTLAAEKSKHEGKKYDSKNPVDSKTKKLDKKSGLDFVEGRPMEAGKSARSNCEDRLDGGKVMECKSGRNCKWKPRCRFAHPEGGNEEKAFGDKPRELHEENPAQSGGSVKDCMTSEIKEEEADQRKPFQDVENDHVCKRKTNDDEKIVVDKPSAGVGHPEVQRLCRGVFPPKSNTFTAEVCHFVSPERFFFSNNEQGDKFMAMMLEIQDPGDKAVLQEVGAACLAFYDKDEMFYRAEITAMDSGTGQVTVQLVDLGATITLAGNELRALEPRHLDEPDFVVEAALAGVQPIGGNWSEEDREMVKMVFTGVSLEVEVVGKKDGKVLVNLTDKEGNNIAGLLIDAGLAVACDPEKKEMCELAELVAATPPALTYGKLSSGTMVVIAAASPVDIHLSTGALFDQFTEVVFPLVEEAGDKGVVQEEVVAHLKSILTFNYNACSLHAVPILWYICSSGDNRLTSPRS